jgi:hypothetical protein
MAVITCHGHIYVSIPLLGKTSFSLIPCASRIGASYISTFRFKSRPVILSFFIKEKTGKPDSPNATYKAKIYIIPTVTHITQRYNKDPVRILKNIRIYRGSMVRPDVQRRPQNNMPAYKACKRVREFQTTGTAHHIPPANIAVFPPKF